jgi:putative membrane protein
MKRAFLFAAAAAAALSLAACQKKDSTATPADPGTSNQAVNAAQDATSAAVGTTSAATVGQMSTDAFVTNAAISDMYEIQAGQIAQKKGQSAGVKDFGKMMVTDHTAMSNQMKPLITAAGKTPPPALDERRKGMIDNLNAAPAGDFDKTYLSQQEAAHNEALTLMQGYADNGDDAGLKDAASKAVPKIQAHLDRVRQLQAAPAGSAAPAKK